MALQQPDNIDEGILYTPEDPLFIDSVIYAESNNNPNAIGPMTKYGQAKGLMQLLDSTFEDVADPGEDIFNPEHNRKAGTKYLQQQYKEFDDIRLALAAYNWGPGNLQKSMSRHNADSWEEIAAYAPEETRKYIDKILTHYEKNLKKKDRTASPEEMGAETADANIESDYSARQQTSAKTIGVGTAREFADSYYEIASDPDYETMSFSEKMQSLASLYNSRQWDRDTYDVVKQLSDYLLYGASPDELPSIPAIVNEVAGPPPTIEDGDPDPEKTISDWQESVYAQLWENKINPAYFGSYLEQYLKQSADKELNAYAERSRGIVGQGAHWVGETFRSLGRGVIRGYSDPAAGGVRVLGGKSTADFIADAPEILGKPSQDYLYETDENGYLVLDNFGRPTPKIQGTISEGIGQIGSFLVGGAVLKTLGVGAKGILAAMGGVNTLAAAEQGYNEAIAEGANEEQAMTAALLSMPVGAVTSLGSYAVVTGKLGMAPALQGLSKFNQAKVLAPYVIKNATVEAVANAGQQLGQSAAVSEVIGRNVITKEKLGTAAAIGAIGAGIVKLGEAYLVPTQPTDIARKPIVQQQELLGLPAPEERTALPAPEERTGLPGPEERKALGGYEYREGPESAIRVYEPLSAEEQVGIGKKLEQFQRSDADVLKLNADQAASLTQEMLDILHMDVTPDDGGVVLTKRTTHIPVDAEQITQVNELISDLQQRLENTPSPDNVAELVSRRGFLKEEYKSQAKAYEKSITQAVRERTKLQQDLDNKKATYESQKDRTLRQVAKLELIEAEEAIAAFDDAHRGVYDAWQKLAPIENEITTLTRQIKEALDPTRPYVNDISAIQKNIKGLVAKRKRLEQQQADAEIAAIQEENAAIRQAKEDVLESLGVEDPTRIPDLSLGLDVEGFKIIPYNNKWYVVDAQGRPLGRGLDFFYDAAQAIKAHGDVVYSQKAGKPEFIIKERIPERTALSKEVSDRIEKAVAREKLNKIEAAERGKELYEEEYKKDVEAAQKRIKEEATEQKRGTKKGRKKKGSRTAVVSETEEPIAGTIAREAEGIPEAERPAGKTTIERVVPVSDLSAFRIIRSRSKRPLTSDYTKEVQFAQDGPKAVRPREVFKAAQKVTQSLADNTRILVGGAVPRKVLGFLNYIKNYIKVGRHDDIATVLHEMTHAIDRAVIGKWDQNGVGDYRHLPREVRIAARDMYDMYYGRTGDPEHIQVAEGLALFFQHYATGQPVKKSLLNWYKSDFSQAEPKIYKSMEGLKDMVYKYQNQSPLEVVSGRIEEPEGRVKTQLKRLTFKNYYDNWHDRWQPIKEASTKAYRSWTANYRRANGIVANAIHGETADINGNKINVPNLKSAFAPAAGKHKQLAAYLVAQRAASYAAAGIEPGVPLVDAMRVIDDINANHPEVALAARNYYQWVTDVMHPLIRQTSERASYLIDKIQADNMATTGTAHGYYVPFRRVGHATLNALMKRKGSTKSIIDPLTEIQRTFTGVLDAGLRQRSLETLLHLATDNSSSNIGAFVREIPPGAQRIGLERELQNRVSAIKQEGDTSPETAEYMTAMFDPEFPGVSGSDFRTFIIMDKNRPRFFEVDPRLVKALSDRLPDFVQNPAYKILMRYPANILRPFATSFRIAFQAIQMLRDPINAWKYLDTAGLDAGSLAKVYGYTVQSLFDQALYHSGKKKNSWFGLADRLGVATFSQIGSEHLLARQAKATKAGKAVDLSNLTMMKLEQMFSMPELGVRTAAMRLQAERLGIKSPNEIITPEQAETLITTFRESTTNFTRQGASSRIWNFSVPFFTARIAELTRVPADIKRNPARMAAYGAGMLTAGVWYALANSDEDWYKEMEPESKAERIWFPIDVNGVNKLAFMPLDTVGSTFWTFGQAIGNAMSKTDNLSPSLIEYAKAALHSKLPINSPEELLGVLGKEYIAQTNNYDVYFKRNIVPPSLEYQDPRVQYSEATTELAKAVGRTSGISPMRIDHAIRNTVPAASDYLRFTDKVLGYKKSKEDSAMNFFSAALTRSGSAHGIMDRSQRLFTEYLVEFRANRSAESEEEGDTRKKLEKINRTISDYNTVIYGIDDQQLRDELRDKKRELLQLGISIAKGQTKQPVGTNPVKRKAEIIRKQRTATRREELASRKKSLKKESALYGDTL